MTADNAHASHLESAKFSIVSRIPLTSTATDLPDTQLYFQFFARIQDAKRIIEEFGSNSIDHSIEAHFDGALMTTPQTVSNFKSAIAQVNGKEILKIDLNELEITEEGAIAFSAYSNNKTLSSAIGDKHYFIIVADHRAISLNKKYNVAEGFEPLINALKNL